MTITRSQRAKLKFKRYPDKAIPRAHNLYGYYDHQKTASSKTKNENKISQRYRPFWPSDDANTKELTDNENEANSKSVNSKEEMGPLDGESNLTTETQQEYRKPEEHQVDSEQISKLCTQIQDIHSRMEIKRSECRDLEESNIKLTKLIDQIRLAVTKLERDIGPTVRSSSVKMEDAENLVIYIQDLKNRIVSGCLLHSD
ncbi:3224_t:CDS:2 [Paraglomus occultum]|uniref:3224_t:CDS:1 n=1 Tax=Paraglomus occultum TaxID=144539 RepID=A0A9N8ZHI6_9GLOM|nr:3224_t:CDS:2 [Paraglomus occultum]